MDGPSTFLVAAFLFCAYGFCLGLVGLWLTSRRSDVVIGRWYCPRCRVVCWGATVDRRDPVHTCGRPMTPTTGAADELY